MKFYKIKFRNNDGNERTQWRMIIDNEEDLNEYHSYNATASFESLMSIAKDQAKNPGSHTRASDARAIAIDKLIRLRAETAPAGEKVYPLLEVASIVDQKHLGMLKYLRQEKAICMNGAGGYCDLEGFLRTWDAEVVEMIEKPSIGFPTEEEAIKCDTLVLENAPKDYTWHLEERAKRTVKKVGEVAVIYNLRDVDGQYVMKCLENCKNVYINSELIDEKQVGQFMKLFMLLSSRKGVYLRVPKEKAAWLQGLPEYGNLYMKHDINFVENY